MPIVMLEAAHNSRNKKLGIKNTIFNLSGIEIRVLDITKKRNRCPNFLLVPLFFLR